MKFPSSLSDLMKVCVMFLLPGGITPKDKPQGRVEFSNVTFAYPTRSDVTVLQNLNLTIPAGAMTAVVGGSGSGKSTIAALLLRFYNPSSGLVLFDGTNVSQLDWTWLRNNVALVSQVCCILRRNDYFIVINLVSIIIVLFLGTSSLFWDYTRKYCIRFSDRVNG